MLSNTRRRTVCLLFIHSMTEIPEGHKVLSLRLSVSCTWIHQSSTSCIAVTTGFHKKTSRKKPRLIRSWELVFVPHTEKPHRSISRKRWSAFQCNILYGILSSLPDTVKAVKYHEHSQKDKPSLNSDLNFVKILLLFGKYHISIMKHFTSN